MKENAKAAALLRPLLASVSTSYWALVASAILAGAWSAILTGLWGLELYVLRLGTCCAFERNTSSGCHILIWRKHCLHILTAQSCEIIAQLPYSYFNNMQRVSYDGGDGTVRDFGWIVLRPFGRATAVRIAKSPIEGCAA